MRIFIAGATGIISSKLIPMLLSAGHELTGTARSEEKADRLRGLGVTPVVVDAFDASALNAAVCAAEPAVVVHQLTSLPDRIDSGLPLETLEQNALIRREGTRNLVAAAVQAGARRLVAQSAAWLYAQGPLPHSEAHALDLDAEGPRAISVRGVSELERLVLSARSIQGLVLRFGQLYGPGTWYAEQTGEVSVHVAAAAMATALAVTRGAPGIYNIVDNGGAVTNSKARRELDWDPSQRAAGAAPAR